MAETMSLISTWARPTWARFLAPAKVGSSRPARMAMMLITTRSSMSVKPRRGRMERQDGFFMGCFASRLAELGRRIRHEAVDQGRGGARTFLSAFCGHAFKRTGMSAPRRPRIMRGVQARSDQR